MVTKIKNLGDAMEFSSNFEQDGDTTTGLNIGLRAGSVIKTDGTLHEFAAGTILCTANSTQFLYVDMAATTPTLNLETTITSGNYVVLYRITTSGTAITNVEDLRSWTSASIGSDLLGSGGGATDPATSFETLFRTYSPVLEYRFNQANGTGDLINTGSATGWDLALNDSTNYQRQQGRVKGGDVDGSFAECISGHGRNAAGQWGYRGTITDWTPLTGSGTGTFVLVAAWGYDQRSANDAIFQINNSSFPGDAEFNWGHFNDNLEIDFFSEGTAGDWEVQSTTGINQDLVFPTYKMITFVQPGDGGGPLLYVNGVDSGNYAGIGVGEEDLWFDQWLNDTDKLPDEAFIGCEYSTVSTTTNQFNGNMEYFGYTQTALNGTQVTALYNAWAGI